MYWVILILVSELVVQCYGGVTPTSTNRVDNVEDQLLQGADYEGTGDGLPPIQNSSIGFCSSVEQDLVKMIQPFVVVELLFQPILDPVVNDSFVAEMTVRVTGGAGKVVFQAKLVKSPRVDGLINTERPLRVNTGVPRAFKITKTFVTIPE